MNDAEMMIKRLTDLAIEKAMEPITITRADGSTYLGHNSHQTAEEGNFQVYVVPVFPRTRQQKRHFRATYYLKSNGLYRRVNRAAFAAVINAEVSTPDLP